MDGGSIDEVAERLRSWCLHNDQGLARVEWDSAYARQDVVDRLRSALSSEGIPVMEIELPAGEAAEGIVSELLQRLKAAEGSIASITGVEWAFPEGADPLETLRALSFKREILAAIPVRQIWWVPSSVTERFVLGVPDLDSWFGLRLHLTEIPARGTTGLRGVLADGSSAASIDEARVHARRFWQALGTAHDRGLDDARIWTELAAPAVDALLFHGLETEADDIMARMPNLRSTLEKKLKELVRAEGFERTEVRLVANRLARVLRAQGDLARAIRLNEVIEEATRRSLGDEHEETLAAVLNLSSTLAERGDYGGARRLLEPVLEVRTRQRGEHDTETLKAMNNLAAILAEQGDLAGARRLDERALIGWTDLLGKDHPLTLTAVNNLAETLRGQGDFTRARELHEAALERRRRVLGENHPETIASMNNLAIVLRRTGQFDVSRDLSERAFTTLERVLGPMHPDTLRAMGNLAVVNWLIGAGSEAVGLMRDCVGRWRVVLGQDHPYSVGGEKQLVTWESQLEEDHSAK